MNRALDAAAPDPPWVEFPGTEPIWAGWRQGDSEAWLLEIWLPYWQGLSPDDRGDYLRLNPPPGDEWRYYLEVWSRSP